MVHPIVAGKGKRLFAEGVSQSNREMTDAKRFKTGIVVETADRGWIDTLYSDLVALVRNLQANRLTISNP
jgi:hypothetical protein